MMGKLLGALLICGAGALFLLLKGRQSRAELRFIADMAAALEQMETSVRFRRLPVPELLREQSRRGDCGLYFDQVRIMLKSGLPLQESWVQAVGNIPWQRPREILLTLEWGGDTQRLCANLQRCGEEMRSLGREMQTLRREKQKLTLALTASACGFLVILLL